MTIIDVLFFFSAAYVAASVLFSYRYISLKRIYFFDEHHYNGFIFTIVGNILMLISFFFLMFVQPSENAAVLLLSASVFWLLANLFGLRLEKRIYHLFLMLFPYLLIFSFGNVIFTFPIPISWYFATNLAFITIAVIAGALYILTGLKMKKFSLLSQGITILLFIVSAELIFVSNDLILISLHIFLVAATFLLSGVLFLGKVNYLTRFIFLLIGFLAQGFTLSWGLFIRPISIYHWYMFLGVAVSLPFIFFTLGCFIEYLLFEKIILSRIIDGIITVLSMMYLAIVAIFSFIRFSKELLSLQHFVSVYVSFFLLLILFYDLKKKNFSIFSKFDDTAAIFSMLVFLIISLFTSVSITSNLVISSNYGMLLSLLIYTIISFLILSFGIYLFLLYNEKMQIFGTLFSFLLILSFISDMLSIAFFESTPFLAMLSGILFSIAWFAGFIEKSAYFILHSESIDLLKRKT